MIDVLKIQTILVRLAELLHAGGRHDWARACLACNRDVSKNPGVTVAKILSMFGGMGSLNDIVLYRDGKVLAKENDELDDLRQQLYELCQD